MEFGGRERQTKVRLRERKGVASEDVTNFIGKGEWKMDGEKGRFVEDERETHHADKVVKNLFELGCPV